MLKKHTISFKNAGEGILWSVRTQPNFRVHLILSLVAIVLSWYLRISYGEFLIIVLLITLGLTIEALNTAIEEATDAIDTKWREDIKIAKDVAAGAVLLFSIGAATIAGIIFIPKLLELMN